jgi:putative transcriptional regulator
MIEPASGILLIADPFLKDVHFSRTVVLLNDHSKEGTLGFILNKPFDKKLQDLMEGFDECDVPVYYGGPVQTDTLHFIHQYPTEIPGGVEVLPGVYWGGDFSVINHLLLTNTISLRKIKFFIGYSGWGIDQLNDEITEKTWLTVAATIPLIFSTPTDLIWKKAIQHLGGDYEMLINYPTDPQLN